MRSEQIRKDLGRLLRGARDRLTPEQSAGGPGRRRTPGLRREEVAAAAGVSAVWYAWLEQGRPVTASARALLALAKALLLSDAERAYLLRLGRGTDGAAVRGAELLSPATLAFLEALPAPAFVADYTWDLKSYNRSAGAVFGFHSLPEPAGNLLRVLLLDRGAQRYLPDWREIARYMVRVFRAEARARGHDPVATALVTELRAASPDFAAWWAEPDPGAAHAHHWRVAHPQAGPVSFRVATLRGFDGPDLTMTIYTPDHRDESAARLSRILREHDTQPHGCPA
ncbi:MULTISPECIES: helix-turn-helix domain-containing protein [unclassified Crossiella]|uniref:MmyB family transcriptional regulator n=1 Tax=unclassified Crossiella TaxID=2620835 RepID=UPI001FFF97CA|nr:MULTISPECIES: helix-turn-helix domain-containing protein [unclassified Crossiella]MCK2243460.1 helix-turn-helix domain-containing protein [Crossiella sp. S99.2]MCK2257318.1 helix-turn-helix domain-containing protein [Crossiella sp. S99.1]